MRIGVDVAVAVMEMEGKVAIPAGSVEQPDGACVNPNWGLPDVDAQMTAIGNIQQMASLGNLIAIAPSASLMNVGITDIPWYQKFTGNFPPYNNDQHPYLLWDMYRLSNGVLDQIGVSPLKHAFLTINAGCGCPSGNIMWVNCFCWAKGCSRQCGRVAAVRVHLRSQLHGHVPQPAAARRRHGPADGGEHRRPHDAGGQLLLRRLVHRA